MLSIIANFTWHSHPGSTATVSVPVEVQLFHVVTLREGRVRKLEFFHHRAEALEAAGLSE